MAIATCRVMVSERVSLLQMNIQRESCSLLILCRLHRELRSSIVPIIKLIIVHAIAVGTHAQNEPANMQRHASSPGSSEFFNVACKVDAPIMSQPVLWVIHTNKCGSIQLVGQSQCIVPYV